MAPPDTTERATSSRTAVTRLFSPQRGAPDAFRSIGGAVVAGGAACMFLSAGLQYAFSVVYRALVLDSSLGGSRADTSFVIAISYFFFQLVGLVAGLLNTRLGPRVVALLGAGVVCAGFASSSYVGALSSLYGTYGFLVGCGTGLINQATVFAVSSHFRRRRALAVGITLAGGGVGSLVLSPALEVLIQAQGWRGALRVLAALAACLVPLASLPFNRVIPTESLAARDAGRPVLLPGASTVFVPGGGGGGGGGGGRGRRTGGKPLPAPPVEVDPPESDAAAAGGMPSSPPPTPPPLVAVLVAVAPVAVDGGAGSSTTAEGSGSSADEATGGALRKRPSRRGATQLAGAGDTGSLSLPGTKHPPSADGVHPPETAQQHPAAAAAAGTPGATAAAAPAANIAGASTTSDNDDDGAPSAPDAHPPTAPAPPAAAAADASKPLGYYGLLATLPRLRWFLLGLALYAGCFFSVLLHLVTFASEPPPGGPGMTALAAAALMSWQGIANTAGRLVIGNVSDRIPPGAARVVMQQGLLLVGALAAAGVAAAPSNAAYVVAYSVLFGAAAGSITATSPAIVADLVPPHSLALGIGLQSSSQAVPILLTPYCVGLLRQGAGEYRPAWALLCGLMTAGALLMAPDTVTARAPRAAAAAWAWCRARRQRPGTGPSGQ